MFISKLHITLNYFSGLEHMKRLEQLTHQRDTWGVSTTRFYLLIKLNYCISTCVHWTVAYNERKSSTEKMTLNFLQPSKRMLEIHHLVWPTTNTNDSLYCNASLHKPEIDSQIFEYSTTREVLKGIYEPLRCFSISGNLEIQFLWGESPNSVLIKEKRKERRT